MCIVLDKQLIQIPQIWNASVCLHHAVVMTVNDFKTKIKLQLEPETLNRI